MIKLGVEYLDYILNMKIDRRNFEVRADIIWEVDKILSNIYYF